MLDSLEHLQIPFKRIHIELTNSCNMDCAFCPKSVMKRPYGMMDPDLAKRLLSEIGRLALSDKVTFHVMGEPTLYPRLFEMIEHASREGVKVGLTTNGTTLGGKAGTRLLEYDLYQVDISLQTPDEVSFALRKSRSVRFDEYLGSIMRFFAEYHRSHRQSIFKFRIMNTRFRKKEMERQTGPIRVICSAKELRSVIRRYSALVHGMLDLPYPENRLNEKIRTIAPYRWNVIEIVPNVYLETYVLDGWGHAFEGEVRDAWSGYCFGMQDHFAVLYNGDVVLCCMDYDGNTRVGNLREASLEEILSSSRVREIVEGFKEYRLVHDYCKRCQGSHSLMAWLFKPFTSIVGIKILKPFFYRHTRLFD